MPDDSPELQDSLERAAAQRPAKRGRPRRHIRISEPVADPGSPDGNGTGVAVDSDGIEMVDPSELEELKRQMSPSDKLLAPIEDYRALSAVTGRPIIWLVKNAIDPYKCTLTVERRAPAVYKRKKVKLGVLRGYCCNWPFDVEVVKTRLEAEQGGEEYVFVVKHDAKPLRAINVNIDEPPKFDPELTMGDHEVDGTEPLDDIEKERIREERMTRLLQTRRLRLQAAKEVAKEEDPAPAAEPMLPMETGPSEDEVQRLLQDQEERLSIKHEIRDIREESNRRFETLIAELRNSRGNDGGNTAIIQAMQQSTTAMMEGLKIVVANVADQIKSANESSKEQFSNVLKLMEMSQANNRALVESQVSARSRETELLLEAAGAKQEMAMLTADKQMELMKQGMEFAKQLGGGGEGDPDLGWANKAGNMLTQIIAGKLATSAMSPTLPTPEQAAAPQKPDAMSQEAVESAAKRIADRVLARVSAGKPGAAPAAPPAAAPDTSKFIRSVWAQLSAELDSRPAQSKFTEMVLAGPPSFMAGIGKAEKITEIISMVSPYVPTDQIGAVGAKLLDAEAQQWTLSQVTAIKAAYARRLAAAAKPAPAAAPTPAAPPAPAPAPAPDPQGAQEPPAAPAKPAKPKAKKAVNPEPAAPAATTPAAPEGASANA